MYVLYMITQVTGVAQPFSFELTSSQWCSMQDKFGKCFCAMLALNDAEDAGIKLRIILEPVILSGQGTGHAAILISTCCYPYNI